MFAPKMSPQSLNFKCDIRTITPPILFVFNWDDLLEIILKNLDLKRSTKTQRDLEKFARIITHHSNKSLGWIK